MKRLILLLAVLLAAPLPAFANERIIDFTSRITINADATVIITETIKVQAAGSKIKHGIYRDFPTTYKDNYGNTVKVDFQVLETLRDGRREDRHMKSIANGKRVYLGNKDVLLKSGVYIYSIKYATNRQIGYFDDHDELYWNVTGDGWDFPIEHAKAIVELPPGAYVTNKIAYTGRRGEKGRNYMAGADASGNVTFVTMGPLSPGQGLTIAVAWPKDMVAKPSAAKQATYMLRDNLTAISGLAGMLFVLAYYLYAWNKVGRDPQPGPIAPLYEGPKGFSPAAVRFIDKMGFDGDAFAAAIVSIAVKGFLAIEQDDDKTYTLTKVGSDAAKLSTGERAVAKKLFASNSSIVLENENHSEIGGAKKALKKALKLEFEQVHFNTNGKWLVPGAILTVTAAMAVVFSTPSLEDRLTGGFAAFWLTIWTAACSVLFIQVLDKWKAVFSGQAKKIPGAIVHTLFSLPFFAGEIMGLGFLAHATSMMAALFLAAIALMFPVFYVLLKAPTISGRKVLDQIEGYKMYMTVAEKDRLNMLHPPEQTPELFEKHLPFALALGVEHEWNKRFASTFANIEQNTGQPYNPIWYNGHGGIIGMSSSLSSGFSSALGTASSPPGSGGGGFGGGGAGGGGGGGGGGGW